MSRWAGLSPLDLIDAILQRRREGVPCAIDLPGTERLVLIAWARHLDALNGTAFPSLDTLAREVGLSERPVRAAHKALREKGILVVVDTVGRGALRCRLDLDALFRGAARSQQPRSNQPRSDQPEYPGQINRGTAVESTGKAGPESGSMEAEVSAVADARERQPSESIELQLAELMALQEADEPQHGMRPPRDVAAVRRALMRGTPPERLRALWAWSGVSEDPAIAGCRGGGWRRWAALLKAPRGEERLSLSWAWHQAGRPTDAPARAAPARASPRRRSDLSDLDDAFRDLGLMPGPASPPLRLVLPGDP